MDGESRPVRLEALLAHASFLRSLASRLVLDESEADDVVQRTFLSALAHAPRAETPLRAWLARVARNHALQIRRAETRRADRERSAARAEECPSPHEILERESERRALVEALLSLPEPYRTTILLRFYEDLPPRAVARRLRAPVETVRTRTKRGLALLRKRLDERQGGKRESWQLALVPLALARPESTAIPSAWKLAAARVALSALDAAPVAAAAIVAAIALWLALRSTVESDPVVAKVPTAVAATSDAEGERSAAGAERTPRASTLSDAEPARATDPDREASESIVLRGHTVDERGNSLPYARLTVFSGASPAFADGVPLESAVELRADARGRFELRDLRLPAYVHAVDGERVAIFGLALERGIEREPAPIELRLAPGRTLRGRVTDGSGAPIVGARIAAHSHDRRGQARPTSVPGASFQNLVQFETETDAEGRFELPGMPPVAVWLVASSPEFLPATLAARPHVDAPIEIELERGAAIEVQVVSALGAPVAGAHVRALGTDAAARTSADGRCVISPLARTGEVWLRTEAAGFATRDAGPVSVVGARASRSVVLEPELALAGRVADAQGFAVSGALVEARIAGIRADGELPPPLASARTDGEGRFEISGAGRETVSLRIATPGCGPADFEVTAGGEPLELALACDTSASVDLKLRVRSAATHELVTRFAVTLGSPERDGREPVRRARCDDTSGEIEIGALAPGRWSVNVVAPGFAAWRQGPRELAAGPVAIDVELAEEREVEVLVLDARGEPVFPARVLLTDFDSRPVQARVNGGYWLNTLCLGPDGRVRLAGLPAGRIGVEVRVPDRVEGFGFELDLTTQPSRAEVLHIPHDDSSPRREFEVSIAGAEGTFHVAVLDAAGGIVAECRGYASSEGVALVQPLRYVGSRFEDGGFLSNRSDRVFELDPLLLEHGPALVSELPLVLWLRVPASAHGVRIDATGREPWTGEIESRTGAPIRLEANLR